MTKTRVLVVEDSLTVRRHLCDVLAQAPDIEVVGEADDGARALELCAALRPDVITMDMMLPVMTGLAATEHIMAHYPTPILIVSASTNRGELFKTYDALAAGAVDVIEKPRGDEPPGVWEDAFVRTVKLVARIRVITHPRAKLRTSVSPYGASRRVPDRASNPPQELVAIGASTGGPAALVQVLRGLSAPLATPVLVVLHISEPFAEAFAEWLGGQTAHRVAFARDGERLGPGVTMAPPNHHLIIESGRTRLTRDPERHSCRPSVDVLFESVARELGARTTACLLTGMGRDGALGLRAIRAAGGHTIAQDEATSIVYGMPREAVLLNAASEVLPLAEIGPAIAARVEGGRK